jgi:hypothetical protein
MSASRPERQCQRGNSHFRKNRGANRERISAVSGAVHSRPRQHQEHHSRGAHLLAPLVFRIFFVESPKLSKEKRNSGFLLKLPWYLKLFIKVYITVCLYAHTHMSVLCTYNNYKNKGEIIMATKYRRRHYYVAIFIASTLFWCRLNYVAIIV